MTTTRMIERRPSVLETYYEDGCDTLGPLAYGDAPPHPSIRRAYAYMYQSMKAAKVLQEHGLYLHIPVHAWDLAMMLADAQQQVEDIRRKLAIESEQCALISSRLSKALPPLD